MKFHFLLLFVLAHSSLAADLQTFRERHSENYQQLITQGQTLLGRAAECTTSISVSASLRNTLSELQPLGGAVESSIEQFHSKIQKEGCSLPDPEAVQSMNSDLQTVRARVLAIISRWENRGGVLKEAFSESDLKKHPLCISHNPLDKKGTDLGLLLQDVETRLQRFAKDTEELQGWILSPRMDGLTAEVIFQKPHCRGRVLASAPKGLFLRSRVPYDFDGAEEALPTGHKQVDIKVQFEPKGTISDLSSQVVDLP